MGASFYIQIAIVSKQFLDGNLPGVFILFTMLPPEKAIVEGFKPDRFRLSVATLSPRRKESHSTKLL